MNIDPIPEPNAKGAAAATPVAVVPSSTDHLAVAVPDAEGGAAPEAGFTAATTALESGKSTVMKYLSPEKIGANQRNAQLSTGPRTAEGKAASRLNAIKHGALARSVLVRGLKIKESPQEFKTLYEDFYASLAPVGPVEEMLVDQIVQAAWRLRRARAAESGEIALSVDLGCASRARANPLPVLLALPKDVLREGLVPRLRQSVWGCDYLLVCLEELRQRIAVGGELTAAALDLMKEKLRDDRGFTMRRLKELRGWLLANPEALGAEALRARHQRDVLQFLDTTIREVETERAVREKEEEVAEQARQTAAVLPKWSSMDRVLRYEKALERQLFRAMNQLERWQRRRQGGEVPAPRAMELSA